MEKNGKQRGKCRGKAETNNGSVAPGNNDRPKIHFVGRAVVGFASNSILNRVYT